MTNPAPESYPPQDHDTEHNAAADRLDDPDEEDDLLDLSDVELVVDDDLHEDLAGDHLDGAPRDSNR